MHALNPEQAQALSCWPTTSKASGRRGQAPRLRRFASRSMGRILNTSALAWPAKRDRK